MDVTSDKCSDVVDEEVFRISLILGAVFAMGYILIGVVINLTGKKILLGIRTTYTYMYTTLNM